MSHHDDAQHSSIGAQMYAARKTDPLAARPVTNTVQIGVMQQLYCVMLFLNQGECWTALRLATLDGRRGEYERIAVFRRLRKYNVKQRLTTQQ